MNLSDALDRIGAIHAQLAKAEVYRGYHPGGVALSGLVGLLAAALQPSLVAAGDPLGFVRYWVVVAILSAVVAGGFTLLCYLTDDEFERRRTRTAVGQFLPCLVVGAALTVALARPELAEVAVPLLPGLWAVVFGLGIFASATYLPRSVGWVGLWYVVAGFVTLLGAVGAQPLSGWTVGAPFGIGQLAMALVFIQARRGAEEAS